MMKRYNLIAEEDGHLVIAVHVDVEWARDEAGVSLGWRAIDDTGRVTQGTLAQTNVSLALEAIAYRLGERVVEGG